jgi:hypothetical protein
MSAPITYVYKHTGVEVQEIKGIGRVNPGETIAIPHKPLKHSDLELVETIEPADKTLHIEKEAE